jgi:2-oxoglutarate dehydrogenase E2 component (dihydrolipoamide succinyltransferase)
MLAALSGATPIKAVAPAAAPANAAAPAAPAAAVVIPSRDGRTSRKRMSPLRRKIAERLVQAKSETAMLTTFNEVNMAPVMELRKRHGEEFLKKYGVKLGFMSFFVKAAVQAMKEVPAINAQLDGEDIVENNFFDIGVAVGTDKGLMVPVVRDCDQLNFAGIEKAVQGAEAGGDPGRAHGGDDGQQAGVDRRDAGAQQRRHQQSVAARGHPAAPAPPLARRLDVGPDRRACRLRGWCRAYAV